MSTAQVVETSVTVNKNSPIQDYFHQDDQTQPTFEINVAIPLNSSQLTTTTQHNHLRQILVTLKVI